MNTKFLARAALSLAALHLAPGLRAQYAPPPAPGPSAGFLNQELHAWDPSSSHWDLGGSLRVRYEVRENNLAAPANNDFAPRSLRVPAASATVVPVANDNAFVADKLLVRVGYTEMWWSVRVEGRSSSVTGDRRGSAPNVATGSSPESDGPIDLHQGYVVLGDLHQFPLTLKAGRQELSYGDERLIGAFAWNNIGRVFDGAKLRWQNAAFGVDAFATRLVVPDDNGINRSSDYEHFSGLYFDTAKIPGVLTEAYVLSRNVGPGAATWSAPFTTPAPYNPSARDIYTLGGRMKSSTNGWHGVDATLEGAAQFGNWKRPATGIRPGQRDEQRAFALSAQVGYTFKEVPAKPRLAVEYNFASGDHDPNDGTHGTFDNLYPTNHRFYGYMDLASWQNLHNVRAIAQCRPHPKVSLAAEGHLFWLADAQDRFYSVSGAPRAGGVVNGVDTGAAGSGYGYGVNPGYDRFVGGEVDLIAGLAVTRFATWEAGYGHFFRGAYIVDTFSKAGSQDADWIFTQLTVRF